MIGNKVNFKDERGLHNTGTVIDKVIVHKEVYRHKPTTMHNSYNPVYAGTVEVNAYLIKDESGKIYTVYPENIIAIL